MKASMSRVALYLADGEVRSLTELCTPRALKVLLKARARQQLDAALKRQQTARTRLKPREPPALQRGKSAKTQRD